MAFQEEYKSKAYRDSEIIVDNDEVIFVKVNSYDGVKYFGPDKMTETVYYKKYNIIRNKSVYKLSSLSNRNINVQT